MTSSAIELPASQRCAFCDYLTGVRPYAFVSRSDLVATMVTREQRGTPHLLVIPTAHRETILDLTDPEACAILIEVRSAASAIDASYRRGGISVWQNNGMPADQKVRHVHFHVAGTLDAGGTDRGPVEELPLGDVQRIAERVKRHWPMSSER